MTAVAHDVLQSLFKDLGLGARGPVPLLRGARVVVVDTIKIVVLVVPGEGAEEHAQVEPGRGHAAQGLRVVAQDTSGPARDVVQVPAAAPVVLLREGRDLVQKRHGQIFLGRAPREAAPVGRGVDVVAVVHADAVLALAVVY